MKTIIDDNFKQKIIERHKDHDFHFEILSDTYNIKSDIELKCSVCGNIFSRRAETLMYSNSRVLCHNCDTKRRAMSTSAESLSDQIRDKWGDEYELVGEYNGSTKSSEIKHKICGNVFMSKPSNLLRQNIPCPYCNPWSNKNTDIYKYQLKKKFGDRYEILEEYTKADNQIQTRCNICGTIFYPKAYTLLNGSHNCPYCSDSPRCIPQDVFERRINEIFGDKYTVMSTYVNNRRKVLMKHDCGYSYYAVPSDLFKGYSKCPVCTECSGLLNTESFSLKINKLYYGQFTLLGEYKTTNEKIKVKCNCCNNIVNINASYLLRGIAKCPVCGKGYSYPEKFFLKMFDQINTEYIFQYSHKHVDWITKYFYDFYIPDFNIIIEVNGLQHYKDSWQKKEVVQQNDLDKKNLALENNISDYIVIDARESKMDFLKNSILNSDLVKYFDLSNIDWVKCDEYAKISQSKMIRELHEKNYSVDEIADELNISKLTVQRRLEKIA